MSEFAGKVVFITGGTSGIGRATAVEFAKHGAKVAFTGRRESEGNETLKLVKEAGGTGLFLRSDVGVAAEIESAIKQTASELGNIEVAFNNAGIEETPTAFLDQKVDVLDRIYQINVKGVWLCMQAQVRQMLEHGKGGAIINNASIAGVIGMPGVSCYIASKHAVIGMTKSVASEFASRKIRVNAVAPGPIKTEMLDRFMTPEIEKDMLKGVPAARIGGPEEIASAVIWLASKGAGFTVGQTIVIDGGYTVM